MDPGAFEVALPDGRRLEGWASEGPSTSAVLFHVGTPCAGIAYEPLVEETARRECRFVTYSRPGYAGSTRRPGRSVADCVDDVAALARQLGLERLHVVGWSGGGPHALACAVLLPELVGSAATLAGVAPWAAAGLDWLDGMADENRQEFGAAHESGEALERFLESSAEEHGKVTAAGLAEMLGALVTDVDKDALTGAFAEYLASLFRAAVSTGIWGWYDDDLAFTRAWGFSLEDVAVPVTVWQGRQDAMVPYAHGQWLAAHVAGARAMLLEDEGHLSLVARFGDVVDHLLAAPA
ncbi:MAG TPA: alpha/beta fold hydrolase [Gaiella sp.]|jgi:pimeloyl-ACP methyl ester carboxylesterase|nr:alpha/beta fold hydrolase [Gaiella sp.]